jgi:hypothetical protein
MTGAGNEIWLSTISRKKIQRLFRKKRLKRLLNNKTDRSTE